MPRQLPLPTRAMASEAGRIEKWSDGSKAEARALEQKRERREIGMDEPAARIVVWSDYVCPFCYLELPVLERLQDESAGRATVDWRAFELRPEPVPTLDPDGAYLDRVWRQSVYPMARERGLALKLPPVQPRSRKALEAAEHARERGRFGEMHAALFRAFFEHGRDIGDVAVLEDVAAAVGLDRAALRADLDAGRHTAKVSEDQRLAAELGLGGVPALLITPADGPGRALLVSGAQPYEAVREALDRVLSSTAPSGPG
jgi:predicted DsbA family dithiol-disulfide isomerase